MGRLWNSIKLDFTVQLRNNLYSIGISVGLMVAVLISQLATPSQLVWAVPSVMLLVVGGSTLLYVAGMILFEKDEGTLSAITVSPLRSIEYLWSKILTLTGLATLEAVVMIGGAMLIMALWNGLGSQIAFPDLLPFVLGMLGICVIYTLIGIILIVRFNKITDFLMPMAAVVIPLQVPFLYFLGVVKHPALLAIPTSAPAMLMQGAYRSLAGWEWIYGLSYTSILVVGLTYWAYRAFRYHIMMDV